MMQVEKLYEAAETLGEIANNLANLPESNSEAMAALLSLQMAQSYLRELAAHLVRGADPDSALLATANGGLPLTESQKTLIRLFVPSLKE